MNLGAKCWELSFGAELLSLTIQLIGSYASKFTFFFFCHCNDSLFCFAESLIRAQ